MINVLTNGANGKMGKIVCDLVLKDEELHQTAGFDIIECKSLSYPIYNEISKIDEKIDVIIDFSVPEATMKILEFAKNKHIPIVIATTGFSEEEEQQILDLSKELPIFKSANMSYDINIITKLLKWIVPLLKGTDIEITETHHNRKIDSPSGTAQMLADTINQALGGTMKCEYDRHSKREKRAKNEIGMTSIRGGNIVGEHTVQFFGESETLEIKHTSYSREIFAEGAIKAAKFIINKSNGLYNMDDL